MFAGSVFAHIDDLVDTWLAELRRILRPGGKLFLTVHLENDIAALEGPHRESELAQWLRGYPEYELQPVGLQHVHDRTGVALVRLLIENQFRQSRSPGSAVPT